MRMAAKVNVGAWLVVAAGTLLVVGGCSSDETSNPEFSTAPAERSSALTLGDFVDPNKPAANASAKSQRTAPAGRIAAGATSVAAGEKPPTVLVGTARDEAMMRAEAAAMAAKAKAEADAASKPKLNPTMSSDAGETGKVTLTPGAPDAAKPGAGSSGREVVVDSLVGQINGKPIYASKILSDMDARLSAEAEKAQGNGRSWQRESASAILAQLKGQIEQELLLSEARSVLSPEERRGLLFFLSNIRENLISQTGGSEQLANRKFADQEQGSLDLKAANERDLALLQLIYQRYILPRVNVSWRDVQVEYERQFAKYNPAGTATIRMIWVESKQAETIEQVKQALKAKPFAEVAADGKLNDFIASRGGKLEIKLDGRTPAESKLVPFEEMNTAAQGLAAGTFTGPINFRDDRGRSLAGWVMLESVKQEPGQKLEDVQLELYRELKQRKLEQEARRYFERIKDKGTRTDELEMTARLVSIASQRYLERASKVDEKKDK